MLSPRQILDDPIKVRPSEKLSGTPPQIRLPQQLVPSPIRCLTSLSRMLRFWSAISTLTEHVENANVLGWKNDDPCVAAGELQKALRSDSGRIDSTYRKYLEAAIVSILVRPASSIAEQNGISAMCSVLKLTEEGKDEDPDEKSDDSPPFNLSALSSVVADIKRKIQNIPDASALLSVAMKYDDRSVPVKIASSLHDQYIEV
jgi:hypothetical protein